MKKISFMIVVFSLFVLVGCGKHNIIVQDQQSGFIDSWSMITSWSESYPICALEKLSDIQILQMDDLVKNCTEKKKEWKFLDGLGWVYPMFVIANNQVLVASFNNDETGNTIVCQESNGQKLLPLGNNILEWHAVVAKIIGKWYINEVAGKQYPDNIYCQNNERDCADMLDYWWRTDGQNYFVAWLRSNTPSEYTVYYVINDKLYSPWESKLGQGIMQESKWNFVGIQNNKIIVKKIKNGVLVWDPATMDPAQLKSNFTLETCEIDL